MLFRAATLTLLATGVASLATTTTTTTTTTVTPLATISPCSQCPSEIAPPPITVTQQFQTVSTATGSPSVSCYKGKCHTSVPYSTYEFCSTVIPCSQNTGTASSATITKTDEAVTFSRYFATSSFTPVPTPYFSMYTNKTIYRQPEPVFQIIERDYSAPLNKIGSLALADYAGSGLCKECDKRQEVDITECSFWSNTTGATCYTHKEVWTPPQIPPVVVTKSQAISSVVVASTNGPYTIAFDVSIPAQTIIQSGLTTTLSPSSTKVYVTTQCTNAPKTLTIDTTVIVTVTRTVPCETSKSAGSVATTYVPSPSKPAFPISDVSATASSTGIATATPGSGHASGVVPVGHTTSTIYATSIYTVTACATTVKDCPAQSTLTTTSLIAISTTVCPISSTVISPSSIGSPFPGPSSVGSSSAGSSSIDPSSTGSSSTSALSTSSSSTSSLSTASSSPSSSSASASPTGASPTSVTSSAATSFSTATASASLESSATASIAAASTAAATTAAASTSASTSTDDASSASTAPSTSSAPVVTSSPEPTFYVTVESLDATRRLRKRVQTYVAFSGNDALLVTDESQAAQFTIDDSALLNDGAYIGVPVANGYYPFERFPSKPPFYTTWTRDTASISFSNPSFSTGAALFCVAGDGSLYIQLDTTPPFTCIPVTLTTVLISSSRAAATSSAASSAVATTAAATTSVENSAAATTSAAVSSLP